MNKTGNILEIIWFVMGGTFLFIGVNTMIDSGFSNSWHYLVFAILALVMYLRRRKIRISNK